MLVLLVFLQVYCVYFNLETILFLKLILPTGLLLIFLWIIR